MPNKQIRALTLAVAALALLAVPADRATARTPLNINYMYCIPLGQGRMECHAAVSGGTGIYTLQWSRPPLRTAYVNGEYMMIANCVAADNYNTVTLNVSDSGGATDSAYDVFFCGDAA